METFFAFKWHKVNKKVYQFIRDALIHKKNVFKMNMLLSENYKSFLLSSYSEQCFTKGEAENIRLVFFK